MKNKNRAAKKSTIFKEDHILNKVINKEAFVADRRGVNFVVFKSISEVDDLITRYRDKFERGIVYFEDFDPKLNKLVRKACILNAGSWRVISSKDNKQLFIIDKYSKQRQLWPIIWKKYSPILSFKSNDAFMERMFDKKQLNKYTNCKTPNTSK